MHTSPWRLQNHLIYLYVKMIFCMFLLEHSRENTWCFCRIDWVPKENKGIGKRWNDGKGFDVEIMMWDWWARALMACQWGMIRFVLILPTSSWKVSAFIWARDSPWNHRYYSIKHKYGLQSGLSPERERVKSPVLSVIFRSSVSSVLLIFSLVNRNFPVHFEQQIVGHLMHI